MFVSRLKATVIIELQGSVVSVVAGSPTLEESHLCKKRATTQGPII